MSQTNGGWEPVSKEPAPDKEKKEQTQSAMAPFQLVAMVDVGVETMVAAVRDMHNAMLARDKDIMAAMKEQTAQMAGWMTQLEAVLMAPRKVTVQRDKDGLAKQAVSEVVGVRDKKMLN